MFREMPTPCVCIRSYQIVSHKDQVIVIEILAIIMFSCYESYKLFLLYGNGHLHLRSLAGVYNI